ncbi:MAG TPA: AarF/UbiB family protein [Thermoanaerobaculia bacterium]|nr:AarF/UbiB family protein [Thermoanaerobaculia bacterium]
MTRRPPKTSPLGRLFELGSLAARAGASTVASRLSGIGRSAPAREALRTADLVKNAHRLVATLGELKGAAMKVGQMLSLQDAFLPPEVAVVLRSLQGETPSLPLSMVEDQLAEELGDPLQIFASFEPEAFAAASIGQVHRAVLRDGRRVAVKIQYPNIDRIVEADLGNLYRVLKSVVALVSKVDFEPIWKELRARLREELDYLHEAERMRRMTELHAGVPEIVIPQVIEEAGEKKVPVEVSLLFCRDDHRARRLPGTGRCRPLFGASIGAGLPPVARRSTFFSMGCSVGTSSSLPLNG